MAVDLAALADDLAAETDALLAVLEPLDAAGWATPTPAPGWSVQDQVSHLAYFDEAATTAATDPAAFQRELDAALADPDGITERIARRGRAMTPAEVLDWFRTSRAAMVRTMLTLDPSARVPWYGPPMSVASSLTARIMETWAHGQDVFDALGLEHPTTSAIRQVCHLGVRTYGFSFAAHELTAPDAPVFVALTGPTGDHWTWGPDDAPDRVEGEAVDFALVVTQRRHVDDTGLAVTGSAAAQWMAIAQAFAGPPGAGRAPTRRAAGP
ncbi:MAG: TIGR03084 family metal-binding protein [Acidimicrobiia bacterium]